MGCDPGGAIGLFKSVRGADLPGNFKFFLDLPRIFLLSDLTYSKTVHIWIWLVCGVNLNKFGSH